MKENVIKVLKVAPHEVPEVIYLENKLEVLQAAGSIGADYRGLIEIITLDRESCIVCKRKGNCSVWNPTDNWAVIFCAVCSISPDKPKMVSWLLCRNV